MLIMDRTRLNKLTLNPVKVDILQLGRSSDWLAVNLPDLDGIKFLVKAWVHNLGLHLNPALSMNFQILAMARSAFSQLWLIVQLQPCLVLNN